jgi:hypothetical protein
MGFRMKLRGRAPSLLEERKSFSQWGKKKKKKKERNSFTKYTLY